jgi:hypothetical protein
MVLHAQRNCMTEWRFNSSRAYDDPFNEIELDVIVTGPDGGRQRVPAYWAGGQVWRVRYSSQQVGLHTWRSECSDESNEGLHGIEGELEVAPYEGGNPLLRHGALRASDDRRYLQHADGRPFFWLGDTWWLALSERLGWPGDFQRLAADRAGKGFNVIQLVAGLFPDMAAFDERGDNEAGWPWEADFARINPAWFDAADLKIDWLVSQGLMPCVLGSWGYYLPWLGVDRFKRHWRYLVARWGAHPVVWCLAGEGVMPWYMSETREEDADLQRAGWTEVGGYLREIDPYRCPVTIHPTRRGREQVGDDSLLDFEMLQTGHGDRGSLPQTVELMSAARAEEPAMPVINAEVCYEGIMERCREDVQRLMFWVSVLSGGCGHTYGANGIWQFNEEGALFGPSPHGSSWGDTPWWEAARLPGSAQLGLAKKLLERYEWWRMASHPEWLVEHAGPDNYELPYCAGIPGELRIIFMVQQMPLPTVRGLESGVRYAAFWWNPSTGEETELGEVQGDAEGVWQVPKVEVRRDWVLVMARA